MENKSISWEEFEKTQEKGTEYHRMTEYLDNFEDKLDVGRIYTGTVMSKTDKYVIISAGIKSDIIVENNIYERGNLSKLNVGDETDVIITEILDKKEFQIIGSIYSLKIKEARLLLNNAVNDRTILIGTPTAMNKAGYTISVDINDNIISVFMPHTLSDINKIPNQSDLLNKEISFILKRVYKNGKDMYIASRKDYLLQKAKETIGELDKSKVYTGVITGSKDFGIFVQFEECFTALLHKSNLSEEAKEMLDKGEIEPGMLILFYVKDIVRDKIYVTQLQQESIWNDIEVNDIVKGTVHAVKYYGVLVKLDYETKGLLPTKYLKNKNLKPGDEIDVVITFINKNNRQVSLELND